MAQEIEAKILEVDPKILSSQLAQLGAVKLQETRLVVDWYGQQTDAPWFLRIRTYSDGKSEVTWKGKSSVNGVSRQHEEINFLIPEPEKMGQLFESIGLKKYAHQEKDRISWKLKNWRLDLDTYPNMPAYLEIEGESEESIKEAISLLRLEGHETSSGGERKLIESKYGLNWLNMRF